MILHIQANISLSGFPSSSKRPRDIRCSELGTKNDGKVQHIPINHLFFIAHILSKRMYHRLYYFLLSVFSIGLFGIDTRVSMDNYIYISREHDKSQRRFLGAIYQICAQCFGFNSVPCHLGYHWPRTKLSVHPILACVLKLLPKLHLQEYSWICCAARQQQVDRTTQKGI